MVSLSLDCMIYNFNSLFCVDGPKSFSMSRTKVWMFWWNTCPMHKVTPREYQQGVKTLSKTGGALTNEVIYHHGSFFVSTFKVWRGKCWEWHAVRERKTSREVNGRLDQEPQQLPVTWDDQSCSCTDCKVRSTHTLFIMNSYSKRNFQPTVARTHKIVLRKEEVVWC